MKMPDDGTEVILTPLEAAQLIEVLEYGDGFLRVPWARAFKKVLNRGEKGAETD